MEKESGNSKPGIAKGEGIGFRVYARSPGFGCLECKKCPYLDDLAQEKRRSRKMAYNPKP